MEYDIATGNRHKTETDVDDSGIAWVSGRGGIRGLVGQYEFPVEVAGVTPDPDTGTQADWFLV
jgi:hypothetical protein